MKYNYYSLHWHMKSGGVKIVIENLMKSFNKYSKNKFTLIESGKQVKYKPPFNIKHITIPELNYNSKKFKSYKELKKTAHSLMLKLEQNMDFSELCVLQVHNPNLFKNSYLSTAIKLLAEKHKKQLIILFQVHDFAEDHRKDCLDLIKNCIGRSKSNGNLVYPVLSNIFYLTINSRDMNLLNKIGIPKNRIFLFPNSVNVDFFKQKPLKEKNLLNLIKKYAFDNEFNFDIERKNIIYPVKVIRRKNIIEAILILKLLNSIKDEYQLLITLDANSQNDIKYSNLIKKYIKKNKLPVVIGFGFKVISPNEKRKYDEKTKSIIEYTLPDLYSHAECILTTSILEGFGFTFIEPWLSNKLVIGRRIDFIIKDFEKNNIKFPGMYNKINIKPDNKTNLDKNIKNTISSYNSNNKDFSTYTPEEQLRLLNKIDLKQLLKQKSMSKLIDTIKNPDKKIINSNKKIIEEKYSLKNYMTLLDEIITESKELLKEKIDVDIDNSFLIEYFK